MTRITELERHSLSDGGAARITRLGHTYNYSRVFPDDQPPETVVGISKGEAYRRLEDALRRDVLELD